MWSVRVGSRDTAAPTCHTSSVVSLWHPSRGVVSALWALPARVCLRGIVCVCGREGGMVQVAEGDVALATSSPIRRPVRACVGTGSACVCACDGGFGLACLPVCACVAPSAVSAHVASSVCARLPVCARGTVCCVCARGVCCAPWLSFFCSSLLVLASYLWMRGKHRVRLRLPVGTGRDGDRQSTGCGPVDVHTASSVMPCRSAWCVYSCCRFPVCVRWRAWGRVQTMRRRLPGVCVRWRAWDCGTHKALEGEYEEGEDKCTRCVASHRRLPRHRCPTLPMRLKR